MMTVFHPARSFTVSGATGGTVFLEAATQPADLGGRPAVVSGTVALVAGQTLYLVVGQSAGINVDGEHVGQFGGGGGGTFVFLGDLSTPLIVAGARQGLACLRTPQIQHLHKRGPSHAGCPASRSGSARAASNS